MEKDNYRRTNVGFDFLVQSLYGQKAYREVKSHINLSTAKKYYLKILTTVRHTVNENIKLTDNYHKRQLLGHLDHHEKMLKLSKDFDELDQEMITFLAEILFIVFGEKPNRWRAEKVINKQSEWKLDFYRQIMYVQTTEHKKHLLFKVIQEKYMSRFGTWTDFVTDVYWRQCDNDAEKFIKWLKENHTDIYLEIC